MSIIDYIVVVVFLLFMLAAINIGFERQENWECVKWQQMQKEFAGFEWTDWQWEQCYDRLMEVVSR